MVTPISYRLPNKSYIRFKKQLLIDYLKVEKNAILSVES